MTFSITGHCNRTGMFGVAITTSSIAVGSRCPHAKAGCGAVATQNITDPNLATLVLKQLEAGESASDALKKTIKDREHIQYRQLTVIDNEGATAHFTGSEILGTNQVVEGDNCVAAGNLLSSTDVPRAMVDGFKSNPDVHLAERLLTGLEAA